MHQNMCGTALGYPIHHAHVPEACNIKGCRCVCSCAVTTGMKSAEQRALERHLTRMPSLGSALTCTDRASHRICLLEKCTINPACTFPPPALSSPRTTGLCRGGGGVVSTCYALPTARCAPMSDRIAVQQRLQADRHSRIHWARQHDRRSASLIDHSSIRRATFPTARPAVAPAWCAPTRVSIIACPIMCTCTCACACACMCV